MARYDAPWVPLRSFAYPDFSRLPHSPESAQPLHRTEFLRRRGRTAGIVARPPTPEEQLAGDRICAGLPALSRAAGSDALRPARVYLRRAAASLLLLLHRG